jgi:hypothetical protein
MKSISFDANQPPRPVRGQQCKINAFAQWNNAYNSGEYPPAKVTAYITNAGMIFPKTVLTTPDVYPADPYLYTGYLSIPANCPSQANICLEAVDSANNDWAPVLCQYFPVSG